MTLTHLGSITVTKGASVVEGDGVGTIGPSDEPGVSDAARPSRDSPHGRRVRLRRPASRCCRSAVAAAGEPRRRRPYVRIRRRRFQRYATIEPAPAATAADHPACADAARSGGARARPTARPPVGRRPPPDSPPPADVPPAPVAPRCRRRPTRPVRADAASRRVERSPPTVGAAAAEAPAAGHIDQRSRRRGGLETPQRGSRRRRRRITGSAVRGRRALVRAGPGGCDARAAASRVWRHRVDAPACRAARPRHGGSGRRSVPAGGAAGRSRSGASSPAATCGGRRSSLQPDVGRTRLGAPQRDATSSRRVELDLRGPPAQASARRPRRVGASSRRSRAGSPAAHVAPESITALTAALLALLGVLVARRPRSRRSPAPAARETPSYH